VWSQKHFCPLDWHQSFLSFSKNHQKRLHSFLKTKYSMANSFFFKSPKVTENCLFCLEVVAIFVCTGYSFKRSLKQCYQLSRNLAMDACHPCSIKKLKKTHWLTFDQASERITLGPLYTRSQGRCPTHIKHSYWCKSWNQPQRLYTRSQGWTRKNLFNLPKVTNKCWTFWPCIGPKAGKRMPSNLGGRFATLGADVSAFINILTSMF
jgi:hypothetical protein